MEWRDQGISLGGRRFQESGLILSVFSQEHGKRSALVYGGAGRKKRPYLEAGNLLELEWKGRFDDQLGHFSVADVVTNRSAQYLSHPVELSVLSAVSATLAATLPENISYPPLYGSTEVLLDSLCDRAVWPAVLVRWEMALLTTLGYGIDTNACAITGATEGLTHVSPRTGRAVKGQAAPEYVDRLLRLPKFLLDPSNVPSSSDIADGLELTRHFLERRLFSELQRPPPDARDLLIQRMEAGGLATFR